MSRYDTGLTNAIFGGVALGQRKAQDERDALLYIERLRQQQQEAAAQDWYNQQRIQQGADRDAFNQSLASARFGLDTAKHDWQRGYQDWQMQRGDRADALAADRLALDQQRAALPGQQSEAMARFMAGRGAFSRFGPGGETSDGQAYLNFAGMDPTSQRAVQDELEMDARAASAIRGIGQTMGPVKQQQASRQYAEQGFIEGTTIDKRPFQQMKWEAEQRAEAEARAMEPTPDDFLRAQGGDVASLQKLMRAGYITKEKFGDAILTQKPLDTSVIDRARGGDAAALNEMRQRGMLTASQFGSAVMRDPEAEQLRAEEYADLTIELERVDSMLQGAKRGTQAHSRLSGAREIIKGQMSTIASGGTTPNLQARARSAQNPVSQPDAPSSGDDMERALMQAQQELGPGASEDEIIDRAGAILGIR